MRELLARSQGMMMLADGLGDGLRAVASAEFRFGFDQMRANGFLAQFERFGDGLDVAAGRRPCAARRSRAA